MTAIIVASNQHCWGSRNEDFLHPQQHPHGNGYAISTRVARTAPQISGYRIRVGKRAGDRQCCFGNPVPGINLPANFTQSASNPSADTGALSGFLPPPLGRRFEFLGAVFRPLRSLSIPLRVQPAKQSRGGFTNGLRSFACVLLHVRNQSMEFDAWRTENLSLRNHNQGMSV